MNNNSFTLKEVRKLVLTSTCICILVAGIAGYYLGKNADQAELNRMLLAKSQEESKAKADKYFAPLYDKNSKVDSSKSEGFEGFAPWRNTRHE